MANNRRSRRSGWILALVVVGTGIGGYLWYRAKKENSGPQYETTAVQRGTLTQVVTATGTLNPVVNVQVGCQVSGRISKIYVDYNSRVKAGQVIAEIDPRTYEAQVAQVTANLAQSKANLELQQVEAKRSTQLFKNKLISASDYDTAIANLHEAQAAVKIQEAALKNAEANMGYCKIYSPVDGVVISRNVNVGQTVAASFNTPTLFQIANNLAQMEIDADVDEADIGGVKKGQSVDFTVDAYPDRTFHGMIKQVRDAPITNNNVVTYDAVISVTNADFSLKPGMTADVSIVVAKDKNVVEIPNAALRFQPPGLAEAGTDDPGARASSARGGRRGRFGHRGGRGAVEHSSPMHTVYVMPSNSTGGAAQLEPVQIRTGITDNIDTEVLSGLKPGELVVSGLKIPGLSSDRPRNPFTMRRRF